MNETGTTDLPIKSLSRSLTRQVLLLGLIGVVGLVSTIVLGFLMTLYQVQARMDRTNVEAVSIFDRFFLDIQSDLQATGDSLTASENLNSALLELRMRNNTFLDVFFVNPQGVILAQRNAVGRPKQTKIDKIEWLESPPPFGQVVIGPVYYEEQTPYVDMATTATDDTDLPAGLLLVRVDLTKLWNTTLNVKVGNTGYAYIADSSGQLVAFRNRRLLETGNTLQKLVGRTPQEIVSSRLSFYTGLSGKPALASAQPLKTVPWFAVVEQPAQEAMTPFVIPALALLIAFIVVGLLLASTIRFTRARIVSPLLALSNAVAQMESGQLKQSITIRHNDELGQLAHSFNRMADQLQRAFGELESQIDALKQAQAALRAKSEELDTYFTTSLDLLCIADTDGYFHRLNPEWEKTLGYSLAELEGKRFLDLVHPDDLEATLTTVSQLNQQETVLNFENRYQCKDGSYRWIEWRSFPTGNLIYAAARDITEHKRAQEALQGSETRFRVVFENSRDAIGISKSGVHVFANPAYLKLFGYESLEELAGASILDNIAPRHHAEIIQNVRRRTAGEQVPAFYELRGRKTDGAEFDMEVNVSSYALHGEIYTLANIRDVTKRKQAEEALHESEQRYATIFDQSPIGLQFYRSDGLLLKINNACAEIFGVVDVEEIKDWNLFNDPNVTEDQKSRLAQGETIKYQVNFDFEIIKTLKLYRTTRSGLRIFDVIISCLGIGFIAQIQDITEQKQAEGALIESELKYRTLFKSMSQGFYLSQIIYDQDGIPCDYRYMDVNSAFEQIMGLKQEQII